MIQVSISRKLKNRKQKKETIKQILMKFENVKNQKTKPNQSCFFLKNHEIDSVLVRLMKKKRKDTSKQCQKWKGR